MLQIVHTQGEYDRVLEYADKAAEIMLHHYGEGSPDLVLVYGAKAVAQHELGNFAASAEVIERCIKVPCQPSRAL